MQEYKREKVTLETRLSEQTKRAAYHDDHLRTIDAWFSQVGRTAIIGTGLNLSSNRVNV